MSNGYLVAVGDDVAATETIRLAFGADLIDAANVENPEGEAQTLAAAGDVAIVLSSAAAAHDRFVAFLQALAAHLPQAHLILVDAEARAAFPFLPEAWPSMTLQEAATRADELVKQSEIMPDVADDDGSPPSPEPAAGAPETPMQETAQASEDPIAGAESDAAADEPASEAEEHSPAPQEAETSEPAPAESAPQPNAPAPVHPPAHDLSAPNDGPSPLGNAPGLPSAPPHVEPPPMPSAPPSIPPQTVAEPAPKTRENAEAARSAGAAASAPADATAFAPKKLRRETPELVRIVIHQPKDLQEVIKRVRKQDRRAEATASGAHIGNVPVGASIGVALDVRGARCDGALQRQKWLGQPIDFPFVLEAEAGTKQATIIARIFLDDAQIGVMAFTRPISGPKKKAAPNGDRVRMKRPKRVFLSYSSNDREVVSAIATAYAAAGVPHFWDRTSLKSGEIWSPRLRREIDRADLFHLCWSKSAAASEWVEKETEHALQRHQRSKGRSPNITVQMLDGPPWAPHPRQLDAINFDDFVRAAIVGYARGDGSS